MFFLVVFAAVMARHVRRGDRWLAHSALGGALFAAIGLACLLGFGLFGILGGLTVVAGRILPVWMGWVLFAVGIAALVQPVSWFAMLATMLWVLIAGIWMVKQGPPAIEREPAAVAGEPAMA
jgi:hypothetical protein